MSGKTRTNPDVIASYLSQSGGKIELRTSIFFVGWVLLAETRRRRTLTNRSGCEGTASGLFYLRFFFFLSLENMGLLLFSLVCILGGLYYTFRPTFCCCRDRQQRQRADATLAPLYLCRTPRSFVRTQAVPSEVVSLGANM